MMKTPLLFLSLAASLILSPTSFAQDENAPRQLAPRTLSPQSNIEQAPIAKPVPMRSISGGITVRSLGSVNNEAIGALSGETALPEDMWSSSERMLVEQLIKNLPYDLRASHLDTLQSVLLLSAANPPQGNSGGQSLLGLRADKLAQMGRHEDVIKLAQASPIAQRDDLVNRLLVESQFLTNQTPKACSNTASNSQNSQSPFWIKALAFCKVLAKQGDQAMLSLSLLQEMGDNDPNFYRFIESLNAGESVKIDQINNPNALELALLRAIDAEVSLVPNSDTPVDLLKFISESAKSSAAQKAMAFLELSAFANSDISKLEAAYRALSFSKEQLGDPLAATETLDTVSAQALLYQVTTRQNQLPVIQTEAINLALSKAQESDHFLQTAKLYGTIISDLNRSIDLLWFAPSAFRSQLAAQNYENAKAWYQMLRNAAFTDPEAQKLWISTRPLAAIAGFDVATEAVHQALNLWWEAQAETPQSFEKAALLYSILDGLGKPVPSTLWLKLVDGPKLAAGETPKPGIWIKMNKASLAGRLGESLLFVLHGLGSMNMTKAEPVFIRDSIFAMRSVGLEDHGRIIALETALKAGF